MSLRRYYVDAHVWIQMKMVNTIGGEWRTFIAGTGRGDNWKSSPASFMFSIFLQMDDAIQMGEISSYEVAKSKRQINRFPYGFWIGKSLLEHTNWFQFNGNFKVSSGTNWSAGIIIICCNKRLLCAPYTSWEHSTGSPSRFSLRKKKNECRTHYDLYSASNYHPSVAWARAFSSNPNSGSSWV